MTVQVLQPRGSLRRPSPDVLPAWARQDVEDLFSTWQSVWSRNSTLRRYYTGAVGVKNLAISIPSQFEKLNVVSGWPAKAVRCHAMRSIFDGYVFAGRADTSLDALTRRNNLRDLYQQAASLSLVYGVSFLTVMRGNQGQPAAKVSLYSANQACALWDTANGGVKCGIVLAARDMNGEPTRYVAHFPEAILTMEYENGKWICAEEANPAGRVLMVPLVHDPDPERPFGHSLLTPELQGIVDKAMRDVLRMEVGAEFFTAPQRYVLGASEDLFSAPVEESEDGETVYEPVSNEAKLKAYMGAIWAITRDENGDVPTVGEFSAPGAGNFISVFENDAQRFSGASNVPLSQLGVLSNTYTSSDALGAANDPLILEVETMNRRNAAAMEEVARLMMAVSEGVAYDALDERADTVQAYMKDPSKSTFAANADAWVKIAGADQSLVGTDVMYEGVGFTRATIDRIRAGQQAASYTSQLNALASQSVEQAVSADGGR